MHIQVWQIILLTLYSIIGIYDGLNTKFELNKPMMAGAFAGLVMGDLGTGLIIGATLQLMILGVSNFGGATIPDYTSAALIATPLAIVAGKDVDFAIGLGVPIGLLLTQLDIIARTVNIFWNKKAQAAIEKEQYHLLDRYNFCGMIGWGASRGLPVFLALTFGSSFVQAILDVSPDWLLSGLKFAGVVLPAVGISMLLKFMPVKKYFPYLILGFVLFSYVNMPMLGVALIGIVIAVVTYQRDSERESAVVQANAGGNEDE